MPDKNFPTPDSLFRSILARARHLKERTALASSATHGLDSQAKMFDLVSARLDTTVIRPLKEALVEVLSAQGSEPNAQTAFRSKPGDAPLVLSITELDEELWGSREGCHVTAGQR